MDKIDSASTGRIMSAHRKGSRPVHGHIRPSGTMTRKVLLVCGILSSLLYVATLVFAPLLWKGYSSTSQTVSELFAIGAPSRPLVVPLFLAYGGLVIAFGSGVWGSAGRKRALRVVGGLLVAYGVVGLAGPFSPIHLREALAAGEGTLTDTVHGIITMVLVLFMLLAIGFGAAAFGRWFRLYSIATILMLVVGGILAGLDPSAARCRARRWEASSLPAGDRGGRQAPDPPGRFRHTVRRSLRGRGGSDRRGHRPVR